MIYEYNPKERYMKVDDRMVYLSLNENEIFSIIYTKGSISPEEVNVIIANGYATEHAVNKYMDNLSRKITGSNWTWGGK